MIGEVLRFILTPIMLVTLWYYVNYFTQENVFNKKRLTQEQDIVHCISLYL